MTGGDATQSCSYFVKSTCGAPAFKLSSVQNRADLEISFIEFSEDFFVADSTFATRIDRSTVMLGNDDVCGVESDGAFSCTSATYLDGTFEGSTVTAT